MRWVRKLPRSGSLTPMTVWIFDLDGTLVDHDTAAAEAVTAWAAEQGWALPGLVDLWEQVAERHFPAYRSGELSFAGQRRARLRDFLPRVGAVPGDDTQLDGEFRAYETHYVEAWRAFPDAYGLERLGRTAVLSNGDQAQQEDKLRRTGLGGFEQVLTSGLLGAAKPDPEAFRAACAALRVEPADAVYVGDRLDVDARAATAAGLRGIWLDRAGLGGAGTVPRVRSLDQLPGVSPR